MVMNDVNVLEDSLTSITIIIVAGLAAYQQKQLQSDVIINIS